MADTGGGAAAADTAVVLGLELSRNVQLAAAYAVLVMLAVWPIRIGAWRSLAQFEVRAGAAVASALRPLIVTIHNPPYPSRRHQHCPTALSSLLPRPSALPSYAQKPQDSADMITHKSAAMFPLVASAFLFGIYLLFHVFGKEYLTLLLSLYLAATGAFAVFEALADYAKPWLPRALRNHTYCLELRRGGRAAAPTEAPEPVAAADVGGASPAASPSSYRLRATTSRPAASPSSSSSNRPGPDTPHKAPRAPLQDGPSPLVRERQRLRR